MGYKSTRLYLFAAHSVLAGLPSSGNQFESLVLYLVGSEKHMVIKRVCKQAGINGFIYWLILTGVCQENIPHTITPFPPTWTVDTRWSAFMNSRCWHKKQKSDQAMFFHSLTVPFLSAYAHCRLCMPCMPSVHCLEVKLLPVSSFAVIADLPHCSTCAFIDAFLFRTIVHCC